MSDSVLLSTEDERLWNALFDLTLEGVEAKPLLTKSLVKDGSVRRAVIYLASSTAVGLFSNWLSDQMKSHPEGAVQIENQRVTKECLNITNVIMQHVTINSNYGEERPDNKRVPQE